MRREKTGHVPTVLNHAAGGHDPDDSSSTSEDELPTNLEAVSPDLGGQTLNHKGHSGSVPRADGKAGSGSDQFGRFAVGNDNYNTKGKVSKRDGRLNISVNETNNRGYLAKALGASLQHHQRAAENTTRGESPDRSLSPLHEEDIVKRPNLTAKLSALSANCSINEQTSKPKLNIVIMVIGSRGDIQPFLKVGKLLKEDYGHRVRIATHPAFKKFVEQDSGLDFFSVGGDPAELMAFMVKNPG